MIFEASEQLKYGFVGIEEVVIVVPLPEEKVPQIIDSINRGLPKNDVRTEEIEYFVGYYGKHRFNGLRKITAPKNSKM